MKIMLTGGITGGHIYPALAIGDTFKEHDPTCEILYVGNERGMEKDIVPAHGYPIEFVSSKAVDRSNALKLAGTLWTSERGKLEALRIMKSYQPDIVISTGSYVSVPVVLAAQKYGAKIFIHEQNGFAGMANKYLSKYADAIFLGFEDARKYFKDSEKVIYTGNPVRRDFYGKDKSAARELLGIPKDDFVILAFGGSQGASAINEVASSIIRKYGQQENVTILFGTGKRFYDRVKEDLAHQGLSDYKNIRILPYISDMANMLSAADVAICRSGALSVSEITMAGCPAIFIPSPNVTGDHQYYNAKAVVDNGGGIIVREDADTPDRVVNTLSELMDDSELLASMAENSLRCAPIDAAEIIYKEIMDRWKKNKK